MFLKTGLKNGNLKIVLVDFQGSDKPGKTEFFGTLRENLENSENFREIFQIPGKLREFC